MRQLNGVQEPTSSCIVVDTAADRTVKEANIHNEERGYGAIVGGVITLTVLALSYPAVVAVGSPDGIVLDTFGTDHLHGGEGGYGP